MKHFDEVKALLNQQIANENEVLDIVNAAKRVSERWVQPLSGGAEETNGLVYGLVQSGKTGVLNTCAALAADEGYKAVIIFTSDNITLYEQTLDRAREAFPGIEILSKDDLYDSYAYLQRIRASTSVTVITKNGTILDKLNENLKKGNLKGMSALLIDDEADQASPNTRESREDGSVSRIYEQISDLRSYFEKNTYLQVTATPQALFLQSQGHRLRPKFTVLSYPGSDYVGGDHFFSENSTLTRVFDIAELTALAAGSQPAPGLHLPPMLTMSLDTFMLAATDKRLKDPTTRSAYLCHVSTRKTDHEHIVQLFRFYQRDLADRIKSGDLKIRNRLKAAYDDLASSANAIELASFDLLVEKIGFYSPGIAVKLVNGDTDEDVALKSPYNLFVGGNKLGRGVTIRNLLVSYYGRNPRAPQADTVLQHARMFGYRRSDLQYLRLYLPRQLLTTFQAIHKMENMLRDLIAQKPSEEFRGVYLEGNVKPTRRNVIAPGAIGVYSASSNYNPFAVVRSLPSTLEMKQIDDKLREVPDRTSLPMPISEIVELIGLVRIDENQSQNIWNTESIGLSLLQLHKLDPNRVGYVYVRRDTEHEKGRGETRGLLDSGEIHRIPGNEIALFMMRLKPDKEGTTAWWPQIRFPDGNYAFAFAV